MQVQIKVGKRGKPVIKKFALLEVGRKLVIDIHFPSGANKIQQSSNNCLLYTSDAADERSSVDLGGRRIINKKKKK